MKLKPVFAVLLATIFTIIIGEIINRAWLWEPSRGGDLGHVAFGLTRNGLGDNFPNLDGVMAETRQIPFYLKTNSDGFRNIEETNPNAYRILAIGDSFTYGLKVSNQDIWTNLLEKRLTYQLKRPIQVLNAGVPGTTVVDHQNYWNEKGQKVNPDLVLLGLCSNDVSDLDKESTSLGFHREMSLRMTEDYRFADLRRLLRQNSGIYNLGHLPQRKNYT